MSGFNVVLVEPEIPNNTGNIGRLCVATESVLHLIHPLGFQIDESRVRRAGLDYWSDLAVHEYDCLEDCIGQVDTQASIHFFSSHGKRSLYSTRISPGDWLIFGKESVGLSQEIRTRFEDRLTRIPFPGKVRSFNLANAVAMVLGEGMRQNSMDH
ncbi:MAG: tRNA (cytidine(34)-2'-O)-methyltransferase [Flavobacteriales bacterium]|nr:tRNA (cytidine(34)-2'-O)-methyltransferase [Flavobacteriales bacterium]